MTTESDRVPQDPAPPSPPPEVAADPTPPMVSTPDPEAYVSLDRRVIQLWRISNLIGFAFLLVPTLILALGIGFSALESPVIPLGAWTLLFLLCGFYTFWYPPKYYRCWGYQMDERVLIIRQGVWFKIVKLLPLSRLQHVDLRRGPLERMHGLASLAVHTAGTREATLIIPGLEAKEAVRLRDRLVAAGGDDGV